MQNNLINYEILVFSILCEEKEKHGLCLLENLQVMQDV